MRMRSPVNPYLNVAAAFAAGAIITYWLGSTLVRRAAPTPLDDRQLLERVRARLVELVSYPDAIEVDVEEGIVRVSGRVLAQELDGLLLRLTDMPGVYKVRNALTAQDTSVFEQMQAPSPST